jgi:hypothetical protein
MADVRKLQTPNPQYDLLVPVWKKCRVVVSGQRAVLSHDVIVNAEGNLLIPFSPTMTQEQFNFYKSEAELPGISSQFVKLLVGGLLRKTPAMTFSNNVPEEAKDWIENSIAVDGASIVGFLDSALNEELVSSRAWIHAEYPNIEDSVAEKMDTGDWAQVKPYPLIWTAEQVLNWQSQVIEGTKKLTRVIVRGIREEFESPEDIHPTYVDTIWVHELINNEYQVRIFEAVKKEIVAPVTGELNKVRSITSQGAGEDFKLTETIIPKMHGEVMSIIPAWPLNGGLEPIEPELSTIIDKEIALYNKVSRRNHLLYGAATYTPWVASNMSQDDFDNIVSQGLGGWIKLNQGDTVGALTTPTDALTDLDVAIKAGLDELAKLGVRMLANEGTQQSGVALQLRSASQTAYIGSLNTKISATMRDIIIHLIMRRYDIKLTQSDVKFSLCSDFDTIPLGAEWIKLMGEYYEKNLIPRTAWLDLLKANDLLSPDYDDDEAKKEIDEDELNTANLTQLDKGLSTAARMRAEQQALEDSKREDTKDDNND